MSRDLFYIFVKVFISSFSRHPHAGAVSFLVKPSARILLGTLWFTWLHRAFRCQLRRVSSHHQDLIFYFYYLYNYYTSFLALCQEKCSLILKKFLSGPEGAEPAHNYLLLSGRSFSRNISNVFIY